MAVEARDGLRSELPDSRPAHGMLSASNGPATMRLKRIVIDQTRTFPDAYRFIEKPLGKLRVRGMRSEDIYDALFGRFEGSPEALAENIFETQPFPGGDQYIFYIAGAAQRALGLVEADTLLRRVGIEAIFAHPAALRPIAIDGFSFLGIQPFHPFEVLFGWSDRKRRTGFFAYWGTFHYAWTSYDAGGCASNTLPGRMLDEYRFDRTFYDSIRGSADVAVALAAMGRNIVRAIAGTIVFFGFWIAFMSRRRPLDLALLFSLGAMMVVYGTIAGGAQTRYEYNTLPLTIMVAMAILTEVAGRLRSVHLRRAG
jgi:hypothetical protein